MSRSANKNDEGGNRGRGEEDENVRDMMAANDVPTRPRVQRAPRIRRRPEKNRTGHRDRGCADDPCHPSSPASNEVLGVGIGPSPRLESRTVVVVQHAQELHHSHLPTPSQNQKARMAAMELGQAALRPCTL